MTDQATMRVQGNEPVAGSTVLEFWRWAFGDLVQNNLRGQFAEWLVARACGVADGSRVEWDAYDLEVDGIRVEVKSSAYLQSWTREKLATPRFDIHASKTWDPKVGYSEDRARRAQVYVFCLLAEKDRTRINPLDTNQWQFFVLGTDVLNKECPGQKMIGLRPLIALGAVKTGFDGVLAAVRRSAGVAPVERV